MGNVDPGLKGERTLHVGPDHTATALDVGDVPVLSTPTVLALAEGACVDAIRRELQGGVTTVGTWAEVEHLAPAPVGDVVRAVATLIGRHGRRLEFSVRVERDGTLLAKVRHRRVLVDRDRFLSRTPAVAH